jgi:hypothetical protein
MNLALFAARLVLLIGRAGAFRLFRFRFFGLLRRLVFALGHLPVPDFDSVVRSCYAEPTQFQDGSQLILALS